MTRFPNAVVDRRPPSAIGRLARLELVFGYRRGRTILTHAYAEPPFRVGRCLTDGPVSSMVMVCCGPGVFGGDALCQRIRVESGARVRLVSQAALQVHPCAGEAPATIDARYEVEPDGALDCFWAPVIPFAEARLTQRIDVQAAPDSRLFWSDAFMSGRAGRGEAWRFLELGHELRLSVAGSLIYLERFRLKPRDITHRAVEHPWLAGGANYMGTTLVHDEQATPVLAEQIHREIGLACGVSAGVDCVAPRVMVGRLLARRGPDFSRARGILGDMVGRRALRVLL